MNYIRNEHDDITSLQDSLGRSDQIRYDRYDREEWRQTRSGATLETIEWDRHANPTKVRDLTGRVKIYEYDELDRLIKVQFQLPEGRNDPHAEFTRSYDDAARKEVEKQGIRTTTFTMDTAQRVEEISYDEGGSAGKRLNAFSPTS
ncbi:MAG: hypothetical protein ND866_09525 [Pyrinomonadaceae bacterium]|nr:hypothetical protein [Pyrinomonadaceae bacterium]